MFLNVYIYICIYHICIYLVNVIKHVSDIVYDSDHFQQRMPCGIRFKHPCETMVDVGNLRIAIRIIGTIEWECLILGGWD